jgi:enoyl-[acyl-carrier protein] reductase I
VDFLQLAGKTVLVVGVANRKSVAWHVSRVLLEAGARVVFSVRSLARKQQLEKLGPEEIESLRADLERDHPQLHGVVHSLAFADYSQGFLPFHQVPRQAFLQAVDISCYSLIALSNALRDLLDRAQGSVVTISISTTRMAAENYGYMAPIKAALDSSVCFLAKSFSQFSKIRFNAVCPGLLKTSASAGIPGYIDSYLHAEQATLRKQAVQTEEVANAVAFLLSPRSSGINAQGLVIDAGMGINYFDAELVRRDRSNPGPNPS